MSHPTLWLSPAETAVHACTQSEDIHLNFLLTKLVAQHSKSS